MNNDITTVEQYIDTLPDWQKTNLGLFRDLVHKVIPGVLEDIKWGVPVFINNKKTLFAMSAFKSHTKYNFIQNGALINDSVGLFNNGFDSKKSRGIDLHEGDVVDKAKLADLISSALEQAGAV